MKQFLMSLLGALSAIWISVFLGGLLLLLTIVGFAVAGINSEVKPEVADNSILHIKLSGTVDDRQTPRDLYTEILSQSKVESLSLNTLLEAVNSAVGTTTSTVSF